MVISRATGVIKDCLDEEIAKGVKKNRYTDIIAVGRNDIEPRVSLFLDCKTQEQAKKLL